MSEYSSNGNIAATDTPFLQYSFQSRTSVVVTAYFSVAASLAVVLTIIYENWRSQKGIKVEKGRPLDFLIRTAPAYVTPYSLAVASIIQEIFFILVQSTGFQSLFTNKCGDLSQIDWAASWTVGYTLLVLSFASLVRSIVPTQFHPRGIWNVLTHSTIIFILLLLTWAPVSKRPNPIDGCPEGSSRWLESWADIAAGLTITLILLYAGNIYVLFKRIRQSIDIDYDQRVAMQHNICYLGVGIILSLFILPYWISCLSSEKPVHASSLVGTIAINIFGVVNAVIFLILRGPRDMITTSLENQQLCRRGSWSSFGSGGSAIDVDDFIRKHEGLDGKIDTCRMQGISSEKDFEANLLTPPDTKVFRSSLARSTTSSKHSSHQQKTVLFDICETDEDRLLPPKPVFNRHERFHSGGSAATVQIGRRTGNSPFIHNERLNASTSNLPCYPDQGSPGRGGSFERNAWRRSLDVLAQLASPTRASAQYSALHDNDPALPYMYACHNGSSKKNFPRKPAAAKASTNKELPPIPTQVSGKDIKPLESRSPDGSPARASQKDSWFFDNRLSVLPQKTYKPSYWI